MFKNNLKSLSIAFIMFSVLFSFGCKKEKSAGTIQIEPTEMAQEGDSLLPLKVRKFDDATKSYVYGKTIAILLGHGYNDSESIKKITEYMEDNYGVETEANPALISIIVYPRDFMRGSRARISSLKSMLEEKKLRGLIMIGAPENIDTPLGKMQDEYNKTCVMPYAFPVFSFLSQADVNASEATADFVLDKVQKTASIDNAADANADEDSVLDFDAVTLLGNAVDAMLSPEIRKVYDVLPIEPAEDSEPIEKKYLKDEIDLKPFVQNIIGSKHKITNYVDGETSLMSQNHFVFE